MGFGLGLRGLGLGGRRGAALLPFSDAFARADGTLGNGWTGTTWDIVSGQARNSPNEGANLLQNAEFTVDTAGWASNSGATLTRRDYATSPDIDPTGGADDYGLEVASNGNANSSAVQNANLVTGTWYHVRARVYSPSANTAVRTARIAVLAALGNTYVVNTVEDTWETRSHIARSSATGASAIALRCGSATSGDLAHFDKAECVALTLASLYVSRRLPGTAYTISVALQVQPSHAQAGVFLALDDPATPTTAVHVYHDGTNVKMDLLQGGTWSNLVSAAAAFGVGKIIALSRDGDNFSAYYDGIKIGATQAIAGLTGVYTGLFSTWAGSRFGQVDIVDTAFFLEKVGAIEDFLNTPATADDFTLVFLPDTQVYTAYYPATFGVMTQWIADHAAAEGIVAVLHEGDVVNSLTDEEYTIAQSAMDVLQTAGIPNLVAPGNHDYADMSVVGRDLTLFNTHFPAVRYSGAGWFTGGLFDAAASENVYHLVTVGANTWLLISLEDNPRQSVVDWAISIIDANPGVAGIIVNTHEYLDTNNTRTAVGESLWTRLVKTYGAMLLVGCGHIYNDGYGYLLSVGENSNDVHQFLFDAQGDPGGGNGYIRLIRVKPALRQMLAETYSTVLLAGNYSSIARYLMNY